jgi:cytochrome b561
MSEPARKFHALSRLFHWAVAALVLFQLPLAWQMIAMAPGMDKFSAYALHKSLGMSVFALTALRLVWRALRPPPPFPTNMTARERALARSTHVALYAIALLMPLAGWCYSSASAYSVSWFGLFVLPDLVPASETLAEVFRQVHRVFGWLLVTLLVLHAGAAGYHHVVRRDNVLISMLPFVKLR